MAGPNGNGPMAVPGGRMGNGHGHRDMNFAGPRSPPNNKSTHFAWYCMLHSC